MLLENLVKYWNAATTSRYPFTDNSPVIIALKKKVATYGEKPMLEYLNYAIEDGSNRDLNYWLKNEICDAYFAKKSPEKNLLGDLGSELVRLMGKDLANKIGLEVENRIDEYIADKVVVKVVEYKNERKPVEGITHKEFENVLNYVNLDEPVILVGPAGSGKNVLAEQVAKALDLDFYFTNAVTQEYKLTGYGDANGKFVETQFYKWCKNGGLFMFDEIDASSPDAMVVMNCALANRYFDFPVVGKVKLNDNCRIIACANTYGTGASLEYVGRNQLDGATLDRFGMLNIDYDPRIEESVCPDDNILEFCRAFRSACNENGVNAICSYREEKRLYKLIKVANMDVEKAIESAVLKGLEVDTVRMLKDRMGEKWL